MKGNILCFKNNFTEVCQRKLLSGLRGILKSSNVKEIWWNKRHRRAVRHTCASSMSTWGFSSKLNNGSFEFWIFYENTFLKVLYLRRVLWVMFRITEVRTCAWEPGVSGHPRSTFCPRREREEPSYLCRLWLLLQALGCYATGFPFFSFWFALLASGFMDLPVTRILCASSHSRNIFCQRWTDYHVQWWSLTLPFPTVLGTNIIVHLFCYCDNKFS